MTLRPFNALYYHLHRRAAGGSRVHYRPFFYPLDTLSDWNRLYGPRGFYQYQCVVPAGERQAVVTELLAVAAGAGCGSPLAVLKTLGQREAPGMMSFPRPGVTLALDFPNRGGVTLALMERLDAVVREAGGASIPPRMRGCRGLASGCMNLSSLCSPHATRPKNG